MVFSRLFGRKKEGEEKKKEEKKELTSKTGGLDKETYKLYLEDNSMSKVFFDMTLNDFLRTKLCEYEENEDFEHRLLLAIGLDKEAGMGKVVIGGTNWFPFITSFVDYALHTRIRFTDNSSHMTIRTLVYFTSYDLDEEAMKRLFNMPDPAIYDDEMFHEARELAKNLPIMFSQNVRNYGVKHLFKTEMRPENFDAISITVNDFIVEVPDFVPVRAFGEVLRKGSVPFAVFHRMFFEDTMRALKDYYPQATDERFYFEASVEYIILLLTLLTDLGVFDFGEEIADKFGEHLGKLIKKYKL